MGLFCFSSSNQRKNSESFIKQFPKAIKIVQEDGKVQEFKQPMKASAITAQKASYFLCSSESMSIGECVEKVGDEEELQMGQMYFLLPLSQVHRPLSLPDLCALAIKASSAY